MRFNEFKDVETFIECFKDRLEKKYIVDFEDSTNYQRYVVLGMMIKDYIAKDWKKTNDYISNNNLKQVYYFSMEFLMGRMITNNLINAGVRNIVSEAFEKLNIDLNEVEHMESDAGLGNGGLGRLAACFMDSVASVKLPVHGNCLRYRHGFFEQDIKNGYQIEKPDNWLRDNYIWEVRKSDKAVDIPFFGDVELSFEYGKIKANHINCEYVKAVPYDMPIIGDNNKVVNTLRLWSAEVGDVYPSNKSAYQYQNEINEISSVLYPNDQTDEGKLLRLKQQYLFSRAGVISACKRHLEKYHTIENLHEKVVFHINDTHPALVVAELMRYLIDDANLEWDQAWYITTHTCAYTNHTILSEALEKWPIHIFRHLLPRIYMIIEEINRRFCESLMRTYPGNYDKLQKMAIIGKSSIRMAHLAIVGSFSVNGVAKLHTEILKNIEMKDWNEFYPGKFNNKTNGITHRRWLYHSNPELVEILKDTVGIEFVNNPFLLENLLQYHNDENVLKRLGEMKQARKQKLAQIIYKSQGIQVDPNSIFDIQVKRLHEYKRQLMNALHIMYVYDRLKTDEEFKRNYHPHTFIFGAKSAPSYHFAKKVIKLINCISDKINNDPETNHLLKCVFVINYNVTYAESIMPACDISEQISTASKEASGTGNMKFMMNGAVTLGTLDGANVEIKDFVQDENIIIFGMTSDEVNRIYMEGGYNPFDLYVRDSRIKRVVDNLTNGFFPNVDSGEFIDIRNKLLQRDEYFVLKDFDSYVKAHEKANELYKNRKQWLQMSLVNIAKSGNFSTDRTMEDYNRDIWKLTKIEEIK